MAIKEKMKKQKKPQPTNQSKNPHTPPLKKNPNSNKLLKTTTTTSTNKNQTKQAKLQKTMQKLVPTSSSIHNTDPYILMVVHQCN